MTRHAMSAPGPHRMRLLSRLFHTAPRLSPDFEDRLQRLSEMSPPPTRNGHRASRYVTVDVRDDRTRQCATIGCCRSALSPWSAVSSTSPTASRSCCASQRPRAATTSWFTASAARGNSAAKTRPTRCCASWSTCATVRWWRSRAEFDPDHGRSRAQGKPGHGQSESVARSRRTVAGALSRRTRARRWTTGWTTMNIRMLARHDALADALATAQLLQVCLHRAETLGMTCPAHLLEMQKPPHCRSASDSACGGRRRLRQSGGRQVTAVTEEGAPNLRLVQRNARPAPGS